MNWLQALLVGIDTPCRRTTRHLLKSKLLNWSSRCVTADKLNEIMRQEITARVDERLQDTAAWQESMLVQRRSNTYQRHPIDSGTHLGRLRKLVGEWDLATPFDWVSCALVPTVSHHLFGNPLMEMDPLPPG